MMPDINTLLQFLYEGDFFGLIQAIFVSAFLSVDLFYGIVTLLATSPIYLRTRSLMLLVILWILLGGFFITVMPIVSGLGLFLIIFAIGATLFRLFLSARE